MCVRRSGHGGRARARKMRAYVDHVLGVVAVRAGGDAAARRSADASMSAIRWRSEVAASAPAMPDEERDDVDPAAGVARAAGKPLGEIRRMCDDFRRGGRARRRAAGPLDVVVPAVPRSGRTRRRTAVANWPVPARVVIERAEKEAAFRIARAALAKSGTSTLELALAGVPMVAAYKVPLIEELIARACSSPRRAAILANLVLGENVVPEFLQRDCTAENLPRLSCSSLQRHARTAPAGRRLSRGSMTSCRSARRFRARGPPRLCWSKPQLTIRPCIGRHKRSPRSGNLPSARERGYVNGRNRGNSRCRYRRPRRHHRRSRLRAA